MIERKSPSFVAVKDQWASTGKRYVFSRTNGDTSMAHPPAISLRTATPASTAWVAVALAEGDALGLAHAATAALEPGVAAPAATAASLWPMAAPAPGAASGAFVTV